MDISKYTEDLATLRMARAEKAKWADVEAAMTERIKGAMGNAHTGEIHGHVVVTWRPSAPAVTLDVAKLERELPPEVLDAYRMTKSPARPFKIME